MASEEVVISLLRAKCVSVLLYGVEQWRRRRSKGARSFRGFDLARPGVAPPLVLKNVLY